MRTIEPIADAQVFSHVHQMQAKPVLGGLPQATKAKAGQIMEFIFQQKSSCKSICCVILLEVDREQQLQ